MCHDVRWALALRNLGLKMMFFESWLAKPLDQNLSLGLHTPEG